MVISKSFYHKLNITIDSFAKTIPKLVNLDFEYEI